MTAPDRYASVRHVVDDVQAAVDFHTTHLGFALDFGAAPAFADVVRGPLRLLLSGRPARAPAPPPTAPAPPDATASTRSSTTWTPRSTGCATRDCPSAGDLVAGPGGRQNLLADPAGNLVELFQPAHRPDAPAPATP